MKAMIREHVKGERLCDTVPPAYRDQVVKEVSPDASYTVILCAHNPRDVVTSSTLRKALKKCAFPHAEQIIFVGAVFTVEAKALAEEVGARMVMLHKSLWTDESANARQL